MTQWLPMRNVVGDVAVDHQQVVVADAGDPASFFGADVDGDGLAESIAAADLKPRWRSLVLLVLRSGAKDRIGEEDVVFADRGLSYDGDAVEQAAALADLDIGTDDAEGPDFHVLADLGARIDDGVGTDLGLLIREKAEIKQIAEPGRPFGGGGLGRRRGRCFHEFGGLRFHRC